MSVLDKEVYLRTICHPEANGRTPSIGEQCWKFTFTLEDRRKLYIMAGREAHDAFRGMLLHEELDDAADEAQKELVDETQEPLQ